MRCFAAYEKIRHASSCYMGEIVDDGAAFRPVQAIHIEGVDGIIQIEALWRSGVLHELRDRVQDR